MRVYFSVAATTTLMSRDVFRDYMGKPPAGNGTQPTRRKPRAADAEREAAHGRAPGKRGSGP